MLDSHGLVPPPTQTATGHAYLELRNVGRTYAGSISALTGINLTFHARECVAVTGRSGSGKSTLLNILGLLDVPTEGDILIDGKQIDPASDKDRSRRRATDLGFVFQRSHLIPTLTTIENVVLGYRYTAQPPGEASRVAGDSLALVGLEGKEKSLARNLSGGEMQRVAIARTLARPALLWLADEPTGNLDSAQSIEIITLLKEKAYERGACLIVVTHEPDIAACLDRRITLSDGRVVADDRHSGSGSELVSDAQIKSLRTHIEESKPRLGIVHRNLSFVAQGIKANQRRAWSGILAAAVAVGLTVAALGLAQSAGAQVNSLFDQQRATQVVAHVSASSPQAVRWPITIGQLSGYSGVQAAELWSNHSAVPLQNGEVVQDAAIVVETTSAPGKATDSSITWASNENGVLGSGEAIVGRVLVQRLALGVLDANPELVIAGQTVRLVGVLEQSDSGTAAGSVFVLPGTVDALGSASSADIYVRTVPGAAPQVAERLKNLVDPFDASDLSVDPVLGADAFQGKLEGSIAVSLQVLAVVAGLAGLVGVIFVNVLGVNARSSEFGVRRAFGARRGELIALVLGESMVVGALGAIIGLAVGFIGVMAVTATAHWQPVFDPRLLFIPLLGCMVFGLLGGLPPAIAAGRVQPADAVRS